MAKSTVQSWLLNKIESFIKKYYINNIIKGSLIVFGCILIYSILLLIGEYFYYFKPIVKQILIYSLIGISVLATGMYVVKPLLQLSKLSKRLSYAEAAKIIGKHFPEINDKLLNILELSSEEISFASKELIQASIEQKSSLFKNFTFSEAIKLKKNIKWTPWIAIPLFIGAMIYFINPKIINESSQRLLLVNQEFVKPAPFDIFLLNEKLESLYFLDYPITIQIKGKELPDEAFIVMNGEKIRMTSLEENKYQFIIKKIDADTEFSIEAAGYSSQTYSIKVIKKPSIAESKLIIDYPSYIGKAQEIIYGFADLTLPEGTNVTFEIKTQFSDKNYFLINQKIETVLDANPLKYSFKQNSIYQYFFENKNHNIIDSTETFHVNVIKDAYPILQIQEVKDSINKEQILLFGTISDDYGITKLAYTYKILDEKGKLIKSESKPLEISSKNNISISQYEDLKTYQLQPGQKVEYFIEAWDNDGVNGPKYARSSTFTYQTVSLEKSKEELQYQNEEISKSLSEGKEKLDELNKQLDKLKENNINNKQLNDWESKQNLQLLEEQQEFIQKKLDEVEKRLDKQKEIQEKKDYNENIKEKQESIEKQLDQLKNKELAEQMQKLQELLDKKNNNLKMSDIEQMQMQNKMFDMSMERLEQMIKDLEAQMMMEDLAKELDKLIDEQQKLLEETKNSTNPKELSKKQEDLEKKLDKLMKKDFQELKNKADNKNLNNEESLGQDALNEMQESQENLEKSQSGPSQKNQQNALDNMQQMSKKLSDMAGGMDQEQLEIDIKAVRQLLTNLLRLSFDQEKLINSLNEIQTSSLFFKEYVKKQNQLILNSQVIKDSLFALSKRIEKLGPTINKETLELEKRLQDAVINLEGQNIHQASVNQQYAMTSANNLALLLNDLLGNLLQQMAMMQSKGSGSDGNPSNPGKSSPGGKPGDSPGEMMQDIITGQQKIGKGLRELQSEHGENGQNGQNGETGNQNGNNGSNGNGSNSNENSSDKMSEQLSKLAYEQSQLRQQLQQLNSLLNSKGIKGNADLIRELQNNMDQIETALINRKIDHNLLKQQENILTRLLEAEDAIRKQEQDTKRQGQTGENKPRPIPSELQKHIDEQRKIKEFYKTTAPELKPFYKKLSEEYLRNSGV